MTDSSTATWELLRNAGVEKRIKLSRQQPAAAKSIEQEFKLSPVAARVLAARGYQADTELEHYLEPALRSGLPNPNELKNFSAACELIGSVAKQGGAIAICCDFDVDGLSSGSILKNFFDAYFVSSQVFVPDRFTEGYGLNANMVREIAQQKFELLIAVDYGTTNGEELTLARELGLKTLVIDHHHVSGEPPPADVFVNPEQQGCGFAGKTLCAAGLVWYLLSGLRQTVPQAQEAPVRSYLDLACLGTICDMVPLTGANRVIARRGLECLEKTTRAGLRALKEAAGIKKEMSCTQVGFGLGPRLNAAGRMVHGATVIELLTTTDERRARKIAQRLNRINLERQETEAWITNLATRAVIEQGQLPWGIVVFQEDFHTGVIGIVAQRLSELFYRPAAVLGMDNGSWKGSVRGVNGFSVVETLAELAPCFTRYGGHAGAGGFSLKGQDPTDFAQAFAEVCQAKLAELDSGPSVRADTEAALAEVSIDLVREFERFAPFGIGNPNPQLFIRKLKVSSVTSLKGQHLKATLSDGSFFVPAVMWRQPQHPALENGATVNVVCRPQLNSYNGRSDLQLNLQVVETCN